MFRETSLTYSAKPGSFGHSGIISSAGEPGDRRLAFRKRRRREESPDSGCGELARAGCGRATRLVTPGGCVTRSAKARHGDAATESATENKPPVRRDLGGRLAEKPRARQFWSAHLVRVKRWGKSPPPVWQHTGHGKPRVEQGQIGGEGRPGPNASRSKECGAATLG